MASGTEPPLEHDRQPWVELAVHSSYLQEPDLEDWVATLKASLGRGFLWAAEAVVSRTYVWFCWCHFYERGVTLAPSAILPVVAALQPMPGVAFTPEELRPFGDKWIERGGSLGRTRPASSLEFGGLFDSRVGQAVAHMLGGLPVVKPNSTHLLPSRPDCVEVGPVRIVGGVRPQNFDVGYRPDGVRFAYDSKTLNDRKSVAKNYQNMINDLATEATSVHSRFPFAVVAFIVVIPAPCLVEPQNSALIGTLERLGGRFGVDEPGQIAEAMALVVWDPDTGEVLPDRPAPDSIVRIERFSETVETVYRSRYKGLPPHAEVGKEAEKAFEDQPGAS